MYVLGYFIGGIARVLAFVMDLYVWVIIIRVILSWIGIDYWHPHPIVKFIYGVTEPILRPIRKVIGPIGFLDISPLVAVLIIYFLRSWIVPTLIRLSLELSV